MYIVKIKKNNLGGTGLAKNPPFCEYFRKYAILIRGHHIFFVQNALIFGKNKNHFAITPRIYCFLECLKVFRQK